MESFIEIYLLDNNVLPEHEVLVKIPVDFSYSSLIENLYAFHLFNNRRYDNIFSPTLVDFIHKKEDIVIHHNRNTFDDDDDGDNWLLLETKLKRKKRENDNNYNDDDDEDDEEDDESSNLLEIYDFSPKQSSKSKKINPFSNMFPKEEIISVIMTHYRCVHLLPLAINSIVNQSYPHIELIVVDDASFVEDEEQEQEQEQVEEDEQVEEEEEEEDEQVEEEDEQVEEDELEEQYKKNKYRSNNKYKQYNRIQSFYEKYHQVKFVNLTKNVGTYAAKNKGIYEAKGRYITFQDSDDISHRHRLLYQYFILHQHKANFHQLLTKLQKVDSTIHFHQKYVQPYGKIESNVFQQYHSSSSSHVNQNIGYVASYCGHRRREESQNGKNKNVFPITPAEISLFIPKQIFIELLGSFQEVRFAADTEIRKRIYLLGIPVGTYTKPLYSCLDCYVSRPNKLFSLTKSNYFGLKSKLRHCYASFFRLFHSHIFKTVFQTNSNFESSDWHYFQNESNILQHHSVLKVHLCQCLNYQLDTVKLSVHNLLITYLKKCYSSTTELEYAKKQLLAF